VNESCGSLCVVQQPTRGRIEVLDPIRLPWKGNEHGEEGSEEEGREESRKEGRKEEDRQEEIAQQARLWASPGR
jgi:hypothetical protein